LIHKESLHIAHRYGNDHASVSKESTDGKKPFPVLRVMSFALWKMLIFLTIEISMHLRGKTQL
jgi:hypothetical protein